MEGSGFGGLFGDPDELQRRLGEFAEQMQGAQRLAWADNAIKLAVDLTVAAMNRINIQGTTEQQAEQRDYRHQDGLFKRCFPWEKGQALPSLALSA